MYTHLITYEKKIPGTNIWVECGYRQVKSSVLRSVQRLRKNGFRNVQAKPL